MYLLLSGIHPMDIRIRRGFMAFCRLVLVLLGFTLCGNGFGLLTVSIFYRSQYSKNTVDFLLLWSMCCLANLMPHGWNCVARSVGGGHVQRRNVRIPDCARNVASSILSWIA